MEFVDLPQGEKAKVIPAQALLTCDSCSFHCNLIQVFFLNISLL